MESEVRFFSHKQKCWLFEVVSGSPWGDYQSCKKVLLPLPFHTCTWSASPWDSKIWHHLWTSWWTFLLHPPCFQIWHLVNETTIDMGVRLKTNLSNLTMSMLVVSMVALAHETTTPTKVTIQLLPILVYRESCPHLDIPQSWHSNRPHYVYTCNWTFDMSPLCSHIWHV